MTTYETESGYEVVETLSGLEVYENGQYVCQIGCETLDRYRDENMDINDDALEADIRSAIETEEFLAYQQEYC